MKRLAFVLAFGAFCIAGNSAGAQPAATTLSADERGIELQGGGEPTKEDSAEEHRAYDKRVGGLVWLEATAGVSRFDATRFRALDIVPPQVQSVVPSVVVSGPEFGAALRFRTGSTTIGARFKRADYEAFDLTTVGLDLGFLVRAVPYVHPTIRLGFNYCTTTGGLVIPGFDNLVFPTVICLNSNTIGLRLDFGNLGSKDVICPGVTGPVGQRPVKSWPVKNAGYLIIPPQPEGFP